MAEYGFWFLALALSLFYTFIVFILRREYIKRISDIEKRIERVLYNIDELDRKDFKFKEMELRFFDKVTDSLEVISSLKIMCKDCFNVGPHEEFAFLIGICKGCGNKLLSSRD